MRRWFAASGTPSHVVGALVATIPNKLQAPFGYELARLTEYASIRRYIEGPDNLEESEIRGTIQAVEAAVNWCRIVLERE